MNVNQIHSLQYCLCLAGAPGRLSNLLWYSMLNFYSNKDHLMLDFRWIMNLMLGIGRKDEHISWVIAVYAVLVVDFSAAMNYYHYFFSICMVVPIKGLAGRKISMSHHLKMFTLKVVRRRINFTGSATSVCFFFLDITCWTFDNFHDYIISEKSNRLVIGQFEIVKHKRIKTKSRRNVDFMLWQGLQDDYRTYCGVISFSKEGQDE